MPSLASKHMLIIQHAVVPRLLRLPNCECFSFPLQYSNRMQRSCLNTTAPYLSKKLSRNLAFSETSALLLKLLEIIGQLVEKLMGETNIRADRKRATQSYETIISKRVKMPFFYLQTAGRQSPFLLEETVATVIPVPITFGVTGCTSLVSFATTLYLTEKEKSYHVSLNLGNMVQLFCRHLWDVATLPEVRYLSPS